MAVLDVLLEGFSSDLHPRGWHGRWIGTTKAGTAALRVMHGDTHIGDVPHNESRTQMMIGVGQVVGKAGRTISTGDIGTLVDRVRRSLPPSGEPVRVSKIDRRTRDQSLLDVNNSPAKQRADAAAGLAFGAPDKPQRGDVWRVTGRGSAGGHYEIVSTSPAHVQVKSLRTGTVTVTPRHEFERSFELVSQKAREGEADAPMPDLLGALLERG